MTTDETTAMSLELANIAIAKLKAEREALHKDAMRYRWLRTCENDSLIIYGDTSHCELMMEDALDAAVDAAMKESE